MKKFWTIALILALALSLAACGAQKAEVDEGGDDTTEWDDRDGETYPEMEFTEVEGVTHCTYRHSESRSGSGEYEYTYSEDEISGYAGDASQPLFIRDISDSGYSQENLYTYTEDGKMLTWVYRNCEGREDFTEYEYEGDLLMRTTETRDGSVTVTVYTYTDAGDLLHSETYEGESDTPQSVEVNEYEGGALLRTVNEYEDGSKSITEYEYADGKENPETAYTNTYVDPDGTEYVSRTVLEYGANGKVAKETETNSEGEVSLYEYEYDAQGNEIKAVFTGANDYGYTRETTYDGNGNVLTAVTTYLDGEADSEENEYDAEGRPVREYSSTAYDGEVTYENITTYVYE